MLAALLLLSSIIHHPSSAFAGECAPDATCSHAIAMWGEPKYPAGFTHFDYTNADAPKGGHVKYASIGTFDNLNDNILKGVPAEGLGMIYDTLITSSDDEPFTKYGLLAETIELAKDRSWVSYHLRPEAKWQDGQPVTAEDVVWSFDTLRAKGSPQFASYYRDVTEAEAIDPHTVKFTFAGTTNRELPLILGQLPILPKHYYTDGKHDFEKTTLEPPLGSGPYKVDAVEPGKWIRYTRVKDYWAKDLPVNKGHYNFDTITYDYYRDSTVAIEAFKAGEYDLREENIAKSWANDYDFPAAKDGRVIKAELHNERPSGMQGFVFNIRRPQFQDRELRRALQAILDFEWMNKNLFFNQYTRNISYFDNSEYASTGLPQGKELEVLEPFRKELPEDVFTQEYKVTATDGSGNNRTQLLEARKILDAAGYKIVDGALISPKTGKPVTIEFLLSQPTYERVCAPMVANLKKLGIAATIRTVDSAQYIKRLEGFDFDMILHTFAESLSPGNEQEDYWSSSRADVNGSRNVIGIKDKTVDALVQKIVTATDKESLVANTRALDRVLLHGHYVIPNWYINHFRTAYWNRFGIPKVRQKYVVDFQNWWIEPEKDKQLPELKR